MMPILERILRGGRVINAKNPAMAKQVQNGIKRSAFFDIQVAENIANERLERGDRIQIDEGTGLLHPPYPDMFMEWQYLGTPFGCYLEEHPDLPVTDKGHKGTMRATVIFAGNQDPVAYPIQRGICLDKASQFKDWGLIFDEDCHDPPTDYDIDMSNFLLATVVTALALINCRNVTTEPTGRINIGRNGTQKRRHQTPQDIRYQTIILPGGGTQSDGKGGHRATALHRVRGHFKTFTTDKPLLGKHTGTYWWGWQVRGNSENGTIISDYQLAEQP